MSIVAMAAIASALALVSGVAAVGDGSHYDYLPSEIIKGRRDAVLYVWVALSTAFSLTHMIALTLYGFSHGWSVLGSDETLMMWMHTGTSLLLTGGHLYIKSELHEPESRVVYLWGKRHDPA